MKGEVPHLVEARIWQQRKSIQEASPQRPLPHSLRCAARCAAPEAQGSADTRTARGAAYEVLVCTGPLEGLGKML